jgi:hypothetical protein
MRVGIYWSGVIRADSGTVYIDEWLNMKVLQIDKEKDGSGQLLVHGRMARRLDVKTWMYRTSRLERWAREMQCRADGNTFCT